MAYKLELPDIGEGVVEAEIQQWFVAPGDLVAEDQPLVEVMTDKATVVIPSPKRGKVVTLFFKVGDVAKVHAPLVELDLEAASASAGEPEVRSTSSSASGGETDLQNTSPSPPRSGGEGRGEGAHPPLQKALATPAVRAMARELGIDINAVPATGPGGRVTKDDLTAVRAGANGHSKVIPFSSPGAAATARTASETPTSAATPRTPTAPSPQPSPPLARGRGSGMEDAPSPQPSPPRGRGSELEGDERVPIRGIRKRIAENMARSKRTAAHFTFVEQADVTDLVRVKERIAEAARADGVKVTFLPFVIKAVVAALKKHPKLNATVDDERNELVLHRRYDLGVAAATEGGLIVPVLRGADGRSLVELARELERLAADTKAGKIRPDDLGRSTFTITSLGALGGLFATPVLNYPEVGILGVHRIRQTPLVKDGQIVVRDVMHVSVSSDHRMVDGHEAAAFAYDVIRSLEDPNLLFMHMV